MLEVDFAGSILEVGFARGIPDERPNGFDILLFQEVLG